MRVTVPTPATYPESETRPSSPPVVVLGAGGEWSISSSQRRNQVRGTAAHPEGHLLRDHPGVSLCRYTQRPQQPTLGRLHVLDITIPVKWLRTLPSVLIDYPPRAVGFCVGWPC